MKKILTLTVLGLALAATPALADNHEGGGKRGGGHKGGKMFEKHDTNGDGVISKAEFLTHAEERFSKMDADGSGDVTKDEAKAAHQAMREKMKERRQEWKEKRGMKDAAPDSE